MEETAMELDGRDGRASLKAPHTIYLVVDTNFAMSHLAILDRLKRVHSKYNDSYQLAVPIQVTAELDKHKVKTGAQSKNAQGQDIGRLARNATDWIYACLHDNNPVVKAQKLYEAIDAESSYDDSILDYCLYLKKEHPQSLVILMTDDKNLCVKALTNEVLTISYRHGMTAELIAEKIIDESLRTTPSNKENVIGDTPEPEFYDDSMMNDDEMMDDDRVEIAPPAPVPVPGLVSEPKTTVPASKDGAPSFFALSDRVYNQITTLVMEAVDYAVRDAFGEDLYMIGYNPDKLKTLGNAADFITRLGLSTFSEYFDRTKSPITALQDRGTFNKLTTTPRNYPGLHEFVQFWSYFLRGIYRRRNAKQRKDLDTIISSWEEAVKSVCTDS